MKKLEVTENPIEIVKGIHEETSRMVDLYDKWISPEKVYRNNNNKIYLLFKAIAGGVQAVRGAIQALKHKFDPRFCSDEDLESAMYIVGERRLPAKKSIARVIITNTGDTDATLKAGRYSFTSAVGDKFLCETQVDYVINANGSEILLFSSEFVGRFLIELNAGVTLTSEDSVPISTDLTFRVFENTGMVGRAEETSWEVRNRILKDTTRQDALRELENAIKRLPSIFECNIIFNPETVPVTITEGIEIKPKEILIVVDGAVDKELAEVVCAKTVYTTCRVDPSLVVYYENELLVNNKYPVYYKLFDKKPYYLTVHYRYEKDKSAKENIEVAYRNALADFRYANRYASEITEPVIYKAVEDVILEGVELMKIYIQDSEDASMPSIPLLELSRFELPELKGITFVAEER